MAATKRIKSDKPALIQVKDWAHADELVRLIAAHQDTIREKEIAAKVKVDNFKKTLAAGVEPYQKAIRKIHESLEAFATTRRTDLKKKQRSWKLNFGVLGWRKSTSVRITKATFQIIKNALVNNLRIADLTRAKLSSCIRIKESVDKDALAKLTDEQLTSVKARRDEKDVFFVEPDSTKAADYNK